MPKRKNNKNTNGQVQSVRFDRKKFNVTQARKWLKEHDLKHTGKVDRTENQLRFRQQSPKKFRRIRTKQFKKGISAAIGFTGTAPKK